jgi:hypothetical protein
MPSHLELTKYQEVQLKVHVFVEAFKRSAICAWIVQNVRPHTAFNRARGAYARLRAWAFTRHGLRLPPASAFRQFGSPSEWGALCIPLLITLLVRVSILRSAVGMLSFAGLGAVVLASLLVKEDCALYLPLPSPTNRSIFFAGFAFPPCGV